jgi:hypothetical protein
MVTRGHDDMLFNKGGAAVVSRWHVGVADAAGDGAARVVETAQHCSLTVEVA